MIKLSVESSIKTFTADVLKEIRADRDEIKKLRELVSELTSVITTTATAVFIKQTPSNPRAKDILNKLCLLPALFNDQFMTRILPRVIIGFIVTNVDIGSGYSSLEAKGIEFFSTLFFSKQPNEKKQEKFSTEVGQIYSKLRYGLLMSSFLAMQSNTFRTFRADKNLNGVLDTSFVVDDGTTTVGPSVTAMRQPFWLQPGYVSSDHCTAVANKQEKRACAEVVDDVSAGSSSQANGDSDSVGPQDSTHSSGKPKPNRTGPLTQDEIATEAAAMVYRIITSTLYRSRVASKIQLFHDVMYLFIGWEQHGVSVDQSTMTAHWEEQRIVGVNYADDLPISKVMRPHEHRSNSTNGVEQADLDNVAYLETLISKHPELSLVIEHDVIVDGNTERLCDRVNLIEVVCRSLAAYSTLQSAAKGKDILCTDKQSFKAIVVLALGVRKLLEKPIEDLIAEGEVPWKHNCNTKGKRGRRARTRANSNPNLSQQGQYQFDTFTGVSMEQLHPPPSKQKELLNQMILNLTPEEFNAKMYVPNRRDAVNENLGIAVFANRDSRIAADESQCVFDF